MQDTTLHVELSLEEWRTVDRVGSSSSGGEGSLRRREIGERSAQVDAVSTSDREKQVDKNTNLGLSPVSGLGVGSRLEEMDLGEDHLVVQTFELLEKSLDESERFSVGLSLDQALKRREKG